jgi:hypothetical protein
MSQEILSKEISISKEGINKRINEKAVKLLKGIFNEVVSMNLSPLQSIKSCFSSIIITDGTSFQLPESLNDSYAGFGGNHGVRGGVKIQYQFSLTDGVTKTEVVSATTNDQKTKIIAPKKNELHLFDLGYFSLKRLQEFDTKNAFYLCRLKINTVLKVKLKGAWVLFDWKNTPNLKVGETIEFEACLGNHAKLKTRLFMTKLDSKSADKKKRDLKRYCKRHGNTPTDKHLASCGFTFHISNVPVEKLSKENAQKMYSLRWQIEIQFKTWKSFMNLDKVTHINQHRFECHHYGTLIFTLLTSKILLAHKFECWQEHQKELSDIKAMKYLAVHKELVWTIILGTQEEAEIANQLLKEMLRKTCVKEVKKGKMSPLKIIEMCLS